MTVTWIVLTVLAIMTMTLLVQTPCVTAPLSLHCAPLALALTGKCSKARRKNINKTQDPTAFIPASKVDYILMLFSVTEMKKPATKHEPRKLTNLGTLSRLSFSSKSMIFH